MTLQSYSWAYIQKKKNMIQKDICTPVFTAALFTITKTREQAKCPLTEEWIKMWYMYTMEYYSAIKKNEITSCAAIWRDLESVILVKSDREGGILYNIPYKWNLKRNDTNELTYKKTVEKRMATHCSILAWRIPCTEELGGLQPMGSLRVRHN